MLTAVAQRWRARRSSYRPAGESLERASRQALPPSLPYPKFERAA